MIAKPAPATSWSPSELRSGVGSAANPPSDRIFAAMSASRPRGARIIARSDKLPPPLTGLYRLSMCPDRPCNSALPAAHHERFVAWDAGCCRRSISTPARANLRHEWDRTEAGFVGARCARAPHASYAWRQWPWTNARASALAYASAPTWHARRRPNSGANNRGGPDRAATLRHASMK